MVFVTQDFIVLFLGSTSSISVEIYSICPRVLSGSLVSLDVIVCGLYLVVKFFIRCKHGLCTEFIQPGGCLRLVLVIFYFPV